MRRQQRIEALTGYAFVIPQLIGFVLLVLIPLINVFIYSFHNKNMLYGTNIFIGFDIRYLCTIIATLNTIA